jgi:pSer/pThr/pTyr-binding forkhead associated (FHA) protein
MQTARITLTVVQGNLPQKTYVFTDPSRCIIGRARDCDIQMPADSGAGMVSRHHCCLEIHPPAIQVRDLGSRNGTYVNGQDVGHRPEYVLPEEADLSQFEAHELRDGDELEVGTAIFRVGIAVSQDLLLVTDCL